VSVWQRHRRSWLGLLVFALAGVAMLGLYYLGFNGKARALEQRLENRQSEYAQLEQQLASVSETLTTMEADDRRMKELFGTLEDVPRRLTRYIRLVHQLSRRSGMTINGSVAFDADEIEEFGLAERSMRLEVVGNYNSFRRFINMMELSEEFLAVRDVQVRREKGSGGDLRIGLSVSTLFSAESQEPQV